MELNLLELAERPTRRDDRLALRLAHTPTQREEFLRFDHEYFDGSSGYGGYYYDGRHAASARRMIDHYRLTTTSRVLDVGCAKGFLLYEFFQNGLTNVSGCDISTYAIEHAKPEIRDRLRVLNADSLDYPDDMFDLAYSIDTLHNLDPKSCDIAIRELQRVSADHVFVQVASFDSDTEKRNLQDWAVTIKTLRSIDQWRDALANIGFTGDCYFKRFKTL
jgi:SAM-dependent methyltransferase